MGGVDLFDRLCGSYRPSIRLRKWWFVLFSNALNTSVIVAWRLHCHLRPDDHLKHLEFRRQIVHCLLAPARAEASRKPAHGGKKSVVPEAVRQQPGHFPEQHSIGRCAVCKKNTTSWCPVCQRRLHSARGKSCFTDFHN